jgi:UDP-N-acetylglucosamine 2-epimerase (non-hydrolysing)
LRDNTERPATITQGTNTLVGSDPTRIAAAWHEARERTAPPRVPALWDGKAAERIVAVLRREFEMVDRRPVAVATTSGMHMPAVPR